MLLRVAHSTAGEVVEMFCNRLWCGSVHLGDKLETLERKGVSTLCNLTLSLRLFTGLPDNLLLSHHPKWGNTLQCCCDHKMAVAMGDDHLTELLRDQRDGSVSKALVTQA